MTTKSKFIIVEHDAKRAKLHWDLRFKMPKSKNWASFAVRKGIPKEPGKKVLAVRTHDHTESEALFLGKIESGYGAGTLKKWDDGSCIIHKYSPAHVAIELKGRKLKGMYHLVSTGVADRDYKRQTYFLFKGKIITEVSGMASRVPHLWADEVEEGPAYWEGDKLPWSKNRILVNKNKQLKESTGNLMGGMVGRVPPSDTEEVEIDNEIEDRNSQRPLPWSFRKAIMVIRAAEQEYDEKQPVKNKEGGGFRRTVFRREESDHGQVHSFERRLHISKHNQLEASSMSRDNRKIRGN